MYKSKYTKPVLRSAYVATPMYKTTMQHVLLLDWDDTVMPTSYLQSHFDIYVDRCTKQVKAFRLKPESKSKEDEIRRTLKKAGSAALRMLRALYSYFVNSSSGRTLVIVTNGVADWLWDSLAITGTLCPIYRQIEQLLRGQSTQIIYARNMSFHPNYWKMASFDLILDRLLEQRRCGRLNVITIGDQWTDHCSVEMAHTFKRNKGAVSHHQIKLFHEANAHYMAIELNYIADLFTSDDPILLTFADDANDGILIEFDGYLEDDDDEKSMPSSDSPSESLQGYVPRKDTNPNLCTDDIAAGSQPTGGLDPLAAPFTFHGDPNLFLSK